MKRDEQHDHDRRHFLKCMAWVGTGAMWTLSNGILKGTAIGQSGAMRGMAAHGGLRFVQISDSHIGFDKPANTDVTATLRAAIAKIKSEGKLSKNPLKESFGKKENLKLVLLALFGATAGQGVVWYTGQFYAMYFIEGTLQVNQMQTWTIIAVALLAGTPLFIYFGGLSDKIGRKNIMMIGMLLAAILYIPIYKQMYKLADVRDKVPTSEQTLDIKKTVTAEGDSVATSRTERIYADGNTVMETVTT